MAVRYNAKRTGEACRLTKELLFAYRSKIYKDLMHDGCNKPMVQQRLKSLKMKEQQGNCPLCNEAPPE
ncbi:hypothetical protein AF72_07690 [Xylella taiwanensis]|uniref:Uncharacterized protein n=1 Tax=Xylella taiwanensis TaxID=1444770 RepID=Z9JJC4_9GAMM|nr:hypothetical protein AB672_05850 [Xylella taiwanensis]EWS78048.1 hypothetical protein AF72_07690 [Xylella taiwanensis]